MTTLHSIKEHLKTLESSTHSPVYMMSRKIVEYLECQNNQHKLTIGGIRTALSTPRSDDAILAEAMFVLTIYPFEVLDVQYRVYDISLSKVIEILDQKAYIQALNDGVLIVEGEAIEADDFQLRTFPQFTNLHSNRSCSTPLGGATNE